MRIALFLIILCRCITTPAFSQTNTVIKGKIIDEATRQPVAGVTVGNKAGRVYTLGNDSGYFSFRLPNTTDSVVFNAVGYKRVVLTAGITDSFLVVIMQASAETLSEVFLSTGFQKLPRERATGSFDFIDDKLISRTISSDFLSRIENLSPGLLINKGDAASTDKFLIRGRSTIFSNAQPLIVLDNFPYDGDINNINPNTIENISILKDAAAASIWGARSANGVIVITTKQGRSQKPQVDLTANFTYKARPDLYNVRTISSADFIEAEKSLFASGYYETDEFYNSLNYGHPPFTPVIELLIAARDGLISPATAEEQINTYKQYDVRKDISNYLYQPTFNQQYAVNLSGKSSGVNYFLSAGYNKDQLSLAGQYNDRLSLLSRNTMKVNKWLSAEAGLQYTQGQQRLNGNQGYLYNSIAGKNFYPYAQLANADGSPAYIDIQYNKQFTDTAGQGKLMNWKYAPLRDINEQHYTITTRDFNANAGLTFTITPYLSAEVKYRYQYQLVSTYSLYTDSSFFTRNMINNFAQVNFTTGNVSYPIPKGGILYTGTDEVTSHQGRAQLNFHKGWNIHDISAIAGYEIKHLVRKSNNNGYQYGYDESVSQISNMIDYTSYYLQYSNMYDYARIASGGNIASYTDNYLSWFANAAWSIRERYIVSGSFRKDEANLFGVTTNMKGTPLWSAGAAWLLHNESFFNPKWISQLKLRGTIGYSGNVSRAVSALSTISLYPSAGSTPLAFANILNPPNDKLRWEKVRMINVGIDFELLDRRISGTIESYFKKAEDLLGSAPVDPTLGIAGINFPSYYGNLAGMKGKGVDIQINSSNIRGIFNWNTTLNFSYTTSRITKYLMPVSSSASAYINSSINPIVGKPLFELFSYKWAGLDPDNGAPLGYLNGKPSADYNGIINSLPLDSVVDNGNRQPLYYGALRNTLSYKNFSLSFTVSYKYKYYFRRSSVQYESFTNWTAHADYTKRWQLPGDEKNTYVPSYIYPADPQRENFYANSSVLVEKADNIRLEDINLSYNMDRSVIKRLPFNTIKIFVLATNIGILWKSNKQGIDPYYDNIPLERTSFTAGINLSL